MVYLAAKQQNKLLQFRVCANIGVLFTLDILSQACEKHIQTRFSLQQFRFWSITQPMFQCLAMRCFLPKTQSQGSDFSSLLLSSSHFMNSRYRLPFSIHFRISYMIYFIYRQHSFLSRKHMNPQLTCSRRQWLHSSVGRASHRYRDVTGSNPVEVLNFFQASHRNCINCVHADDHFFIFISFPQFIYDLIHIPYH